MLWRIDDDNPFRILFNERPGSVRKPYADFLIMVVKNITADEWPFEGDFSGTNIFPGTLLIEAAAQAALVVDYVSREGGDKRLIYMLGRVKARFLGPVGIGSAFDW